MKEKLLFHGASSEVITPFTKEGKIDFGLLEGEIEFLIQNEITGIFVNGLASEALMFSIDDRVEVVRKSVEISKGRIPVVGNLIYNSADMAIDCVHRYEDVGCDSVIITPPLVYKYTENGLYNYFANIAQSTKLPVYLYNAPETNNKVPPNVIARLFKDIPNMRGYKDSTQDIIHLQTTLRSIGADRHFELMAGSDAQILTTYMLGGVGVFSLLTCVFPKLIVEACKKCEEENWDEARELQYKILRVREAMKVGPFMAAYKFVSERIGAPYGYMKAPLEEVSSDDKLKILKVLEDMEMI